MTKHPTGRDRMHEIRGTGYDGDAYSSPNEYDDGQLTGIVPQGTGMLTAGFEQNKRYGVGSPNAFKQLNYTSSPSRKLPSKPGFKVKSK